MEGEAGVFQVSIPSFPDFTSISNTWNHFGRPPPPLPLLLLALSVFSDGELEAVSLFLPGWRVTSVHLRDEKMTIFLQTPFPYSPLFLFFCQVRGWGGRKLLPSGWAGGLETQLLCPPRPAGGGRGSGSEVWTGSKPEPSGNWLGMTQEKLPPPLHHPCPVLLCFP